MFPNDCGNFFDCSAGKDLSLEQVLKMLIKADANGCPVLTIGGVVDTTGATELIADTPNLIQDAVSVIPQNTPINVVSFSIIFDGTGGTLNGIPVPDKYQVNYGNGFNLITNVIPYTRPTSLSGRVLISTLS
jgi:hypothetical protein